MILIISSYTQEELYGAVISSPVLGELPVDTFISSFHISSEYRCNHCDKLLAKSGENGIISGSIKCPRCKEINTI